MTYRRYKRKRSKKSVIAALISTGIAVAALIAIIAVIGDPTGSGRISGGGSAGAGSQNTTQTVTTSETTESTEKEETTQTASEAMTTETESETTATEEKSGGMTNPKNLEEALDTEREATKRVYLSFDDGPSIHTDKILDVLKEKNVKATFFNLEMKQDDLLAAERRAYDEGHTIAIHTKSHDYEKVYASFDAWKEDVLAEQENIRKNVGITTKYYRFPGGSSTSMGKRYGTDIAKCIEWLDENGFTYVDWNVSNEDAEGVEYTADQLVENVVTSIEKLESKGTEDYMVLMHDSKPKETTVEALPKLIDTLKSKGYTFCQLTDNTVQIHHHLYEG